jgi:protein TonB
MSLRALLFCPDEKTAKVVAQVLSDVDFTVEQAAEPFAAVKKLSSQSFDALVVECANEQNASLLMKSARNSASNQGSLIVALVEGQIGVANAFRIGANLVLTKPIAVEQAKSTLRVARGLLRKGGDPSLAPAATPKPAAPAKTLAPPVPARPQTPSLPTGTLTNTVPATPRPVTTPAVSMTGNFEVEAESTPQPDAADTSLLESMGNVAPPAAAAPTRQLAPRPAAGIAKPAAWPLETSAPHASRVPEPELTTVDSAFSAASPLPIAEAPVSTSTASAAAAPARIPVSPERVQGEMPVAYPDFPDLHPKEDVEARRKAPFIAAVAILFVAAALYFGWSMLRNSGKTPPKPVEPVVNNGGFPTAPVSDATLPAPTNANPAPAKTAPAPETITKFVVPTEPANSADNAGKTALQVHSEKREVRPAPDTSEAVAAPALGTLATSDPGTALNSLVAHPPTALPSESPQDIRISQGVSQGLLLKRVQPIYPPQARQARIEGAVELTATITKDGSTRDVKVISGPALLGKVAVDAVRQWKYKPYYLNGEPVEVQTQIMLNFKLPN